MEGLLVLLQSHPLAVAGIIPALALLWFGAALFSK